MRLEVIVAKKKSDNNDANDQNQDGRKKYEVVSIHRSATRASAGR
jgi:hypothetical protein